MSEANESGDILEVESRSSGLLYHYTSEAGLLGILESDNIRGTHVRFLNDSTEFKEAFKDEYVSVLVDSFRKDLPEEDDLEAREAIAKFLSQKNYHKILGIIERSDSTSETFICSFTSDGHQTLGVSCDAGDRLSQWRGYSHSSQAFSLGFDEVRLRKQLSVLNGQKARAELSECIYGDEEKTALFMELGHLAALKYRELKDNTDGLPSVLKSIRPNAGEAYQKAMDCVLKSLSDATAYFFTKAARIKHKGFLEEAEWRAIYQAKREVLFPPQEDREMSEIVKFRNGQFGQTPYIEIPLGLRDPETSPLRKVMVGPGPHKEDMKRWVELILLRHGMGKRVAVGVSGIPYRG